jgi:hypothetical protein
MTEKPMVETDEPKQKDRAQLSDDTTDQQTHQFSRLALQGDRTEIAIRQHAAEGQDLGDTMEGRETILNLRHYISNGRPWLRTQRKKK